MAYNNISKCPHCSNYVEGKRVSSFKGKTARTAAKAFVKEGSQDFVKLGTMGAGAAAGAAIGSVVPVIGTGIGAAIGAAAGWVGKALANDAIGKKVDQAADYLEDEYTEVVYQYSCPRCGHTWVSNGNDQKNDYCYERSSAYGNNTRSYSSNNNYNNSNESKILELIKMNSDHSIWLDESCGIDCVNISKLRNSLSRNYFLDLSIKEISSCSTIGELVEFIEMRLR